ncbi:UNVERIFIED_CONTAM: LEAF RUST 10 DISEASE-RESISTANCE LOCUS RECEPTOR-LIKE PROTEIN KINASE-like 2.5 [Sesamum calycinum]|uniref:LEAF RUST 10 DISEASE-RESISTANCE LOCUS RECEPTOR-LIKE PROTEIN KINASE-like 2.5 n=1 Tax=Sesamum calycinum TaxID=2727403 RepID=A0AAW2SWJ9_9LAMI
MHSKPSQELFLILLALATLLPLHFPGFYSQQDECSHSFQCGNITNITYPFWGGSQPQACGLSGFQLNDCDGDFPLLYISPLTYRNITLFFDCVFYNRELTSLPYLLGCVNLFTKRVAAAGPGPNITCSNNVSVPVNQTAAQALENPKAASQGDVLREALASGFLIQWLGQIQWTAQRPAPPSPVYQEGSRVIPPAPSPGSSISNGREQSPNFYIVVAIIGTGVVILSVIICCCYLKRRSGLAGPDKENIEKILLQHGSLAPKRYKYSEIKKITKSFKDKLGQGGFGSVYQGMLPDGSPVAVKVLINSDRNGEEFINEVASICRTSHVNIVNLLGFCYDGNKKALVYEFMPNKSLDKFISNNADSQLDCEKLYKISVGVAKGLEYLHTGCNTRIVHFDIKPHNILLDEDFCPKICDFGLAKLCKKKQSILSVLGTRGTIGYIAPEVFSRNYGGVSHKSDVYSYGMMVLEMVGAKKIVEPEATQSSENYFPDRIYEQVVLNVGTNSNDLMIEEEEETTRKMFLVGFWCIQTNPSDRPSTSKVVEMLEGSVQSIPIPPKPVLFTPTFPTSGPEFSSTLSAYVDIENSIISGATVM